MPARETVHFGSKSQCCGRPPNKKHDGIALVNKQAAILVRDAEAKEKLIPLAIETVTNRTLLDSLGQNALKMALPDSAEIIAKEVLKLADKNN